MYKRKRMSISRAGHIALLASLPCTLWAQLQPGTVPSGIAIRVVEGDGAINSIRLRRAREPVVEVRDQRGEPIAGATVSFVLPATGASGSFGASGLSLTTQTDEQGKAAGRGLRPNQIAGQFRIRVTASLRGATAVATLLQTNAEPMASGNSKKIVLIGLIAAGVAGGVLGASHKGGSSAASGATAAPPPPAPGGSISAGTPSFGPPK